MSTDVKIIGLDKLIYCLNHLPDRVSYRILISALKRAAKPILNASRRHVKTRTGNLKKSIRIFPGKSKDFPAVWIAPRSGKRAGKFDGWYAHFVHFGTKGFGKRNRVGYVTMGYSKKGTGIRANPFMTLGFDEAKDDAFGTLHAELSNSVVKFLQKSLPK